MTGMYHYSHGESYGVDSSSLQSLGEDGVGEGTDQAEPVDLHRQITEREKKSEKGNFHDKYDGCGHRQKQRKLSKQMF